METTDPKTQLLCRYKAAVKTLKDRSITAASASTKAATSSQHAAAEDGTEAEAVADSLRDLGKQAQRLLDLEQDEESRTADGARAVADDDVLDKLDGLIETARSKFYSYRLDRLPPVWRDVFSDAHILKTHHRLLLQTATGEPLTELLDFMSEHLDRAVIVAGKNAGSLGSRWIDETMSLLEAWEEVESKAAAAAEEEEDRPAKRARRDDGDGDGTLSRSEPFGRPPVSPEHEIPRYNDWSFDKFEDYMNSPSQHPRPIILTNQIQAWPALTDHPWASRSYLLSKTFRGRRLVPVEIGRSYVDDNWGQELVPFRVFLEKYIDPPSRARDDPSTVGYLAQHDLFQQLPSLRNDITVPDFCWASVPRHPTDPSADKPTLEYPQLNAWFGPARTITPLHTDGYHNLLCQVVGTKYVRLYPPTVDKQVIRPRGEEMGVSMANTSELDVGVLEGWDEPGEGLDKVEVDAMRDDLKDTEYWEGVLGPGDTLLIPIGWWHYVRSLSVSFSVSFWWN